MIWRSKSLLLDTSCFYSLVNTYSLCQPRLNFLTCVSACLCGLQRGASDVKVAKSMTDLALVSFRFAVMCVSFCILILHNQWNVAICRGLQLDIRKVSWCPGCIFTLLIFVTLVQCGQTCWCHHFWFNLCLLLAKHWSHFVSFTCSRIQYSKQHPTNWLKKSNDTALC